MYVNLMTIIRICREEKYSFHYETTILTHFYHRNKNIYICSHKKIR